MVVSVVSFSFSRAAQPEAQGLSFLLSAGFLYYILSATSLDLNSSGAPMAPSVWCGFPYHNSSISPSPTVWILVFTELYNSSTPNQSPTRSLEWHVWSSSSGNNCHAVDRSLSSGASLWSGTFTLSHIISRAHLRDFHWNVSLSSGASLWMAFLAGSKVKIQHPADFLETYVWH